MTDIEMEQGEIQKDSYIQKHKRIFTPISTIVILIAIINVAYLIKTEVRIQKSRINADLNNLHLNWTDFSKDDYAKVTYIRCSYESSFSDLEILRKFINLETLEFYHIQIKKKELPNWKKVLAKIGFTKIDNSRLLDISPIRKLTKLQTLYLAGFSFRNAKVLKKLTNLKELNLSSSNISDLEPLKTLINLQTLNITNCKNINNEQVEDLQKVLPNLMIIRQL